MLRDLQVNAVVTGTRRFGEINKSVTLLCPQLGVINAVIYGGRKGKNSSLAPLFSYGVFQLYHDPVKDQYSVKEQNLVFIPQNIISDIGATYTASFMCEVMNSIKTDDCLSYYNLMTAALSTLEKDISSRRKVLIDFSERVLILSGVFTDFESCPVCDKPYSEEEKLGFSGEITAPCCMECSNMDIQLLPGSRRYLRYTMNMSFEDAYKTELYQTAQDRLVKFLISWISIFCSKPLKTVQSGLL